MGCCCSGDAEEIPLRPTPHPNVQPPPRRPSKMSCNICGGMYDSALIDGHVETCRVRARQAIRLHDAAPPPPMMTREESSILFDDADKCVVCFVEPRGCAFVPCGHLVTCHSCALVLNECPICRGPREKLLLVDPRCGCICRHCKHSIEPTFFDGHQEVCLLRMNQAARESAAMSPQEAASSPDRPSHSSSRKELEMCVECKTAKRQVAFSPCAHFLMCDECARKASRCPLCLEDVKLIVTVFL